ncbi:2-octaprenyl-6-methoxyphenyl hydroxylase [Teredinibacter purpureus]|uniref:2-octaprenyl-6-methoxyphenyl hydroxylase n=1 Tax=Teredinibacter purpureus TaxID=2731756 RepID=UPI0005F87898|nr:2-octaprenyl-6-methoxyphenyl hydroxylase [Teredinibacter purpureus]
MTLQLSENSVADIAIVGGGMVGLSQALLLSYQLPDARIVLFDALPITPKTKRLTQPSFDERSSALSAATAELLQLINLWPAIAERAEPIRRVHVSDKGHIGATDFSEDETDADALGYVVENRWLGEQLAQAVLAAPNIALVAPANVQRIRPLATGAAIHYTVEPDECEQAPNNTTVNALGVELVIVGDGADSALRKQLGIEADIHDYEQHAIIANLAFEQPHKGQAFERFTAEGPMAVLPLPAVITGEDSQRSALVWTRPNSLSEQTMAWDDTTFMAHFQQAFGYRLGQCSRVGKRHCYPLKMVLAKEQVRSSVVLMGNAAHFLHPVAGQGFNLAIRDCAQLSAVLTQARAQGEALGHLSVLNRYLSLQAQDQRLTAGLGHAFIQVFSHTNPAVQLSRNVALLGLEHFTCARQTFFAQMMGRMAPRAHMRQVSNP